MNVSIRTHGELVGNTRKSIFPVDGNKFFLGSSVLIQHLSACHYSLQSAEDHGVE